MRSSRLRSAKLVGAGWLAALALFTASAAAAPPARISVEIEPGGNNAASSLVRRILPHQIARELAASPGNGFPPGSRLVIRIREIFLSSDPGAFGYGSFGRTLVMPDAIDGEAFIVDSRGAVLSRHSVAGRSAPSGFLGSPDNEPRRIEALSATLAYWIARELR